MWLLYAQFEIRQKNLQAARKTMVRLRPSWSLTELTPDFTKRVFCGQGTAIGKCPKNKLLKGYIELELQLREFDRCRKLYEKYLEFSPENCTTWIKFAELETILGDTDRARAIFELAIGQPRLDMPEVTSAFCGLPCHVVIATSYLCMVTRQLLALGFPGAVEVLHRL